MRGGERCGCGVGLTELRVRRCLRSTGQPRAAVPTWFLPLYSACLEIFSRTPTHTSAKNSDEPP